MTENRQSPRQRRLKSGQLFSLDGKIVLTCTVRDVSATGARLRVGEAFMVPHSFLVTIPGEMELRPAERIWVRGQEVGVKFKV